MQPRPEINPLLLELVEAHRKARREDLADALAACGLHQHGGPIFGVEFVAIDANNYAPEPGGRAALIIPHCEGGRLLDLVACGLATRTCRTREGICTALGADQIDLARETETVVRLYADPLEWLQHGRQGACVVDWRAARHVLADVPAVDCNDNKALADRIDKAMRQPVHVPRLIVREAPATSAPIDKTAEIEAREAWAAKTAEHKIRKAATETHPYFDSIGFPKMRGLVHEGLLLVPMRLDGRTVSLQEIAADGTARFLAGGRMAGASFTMGTGRGEVLCADYAAALSIKAALDGLHLPARVTCCFTADNLSAIAERRRHAVTIIADNDGDSRARIWRGLSWAMPPVPGTVNDFHRSEGLPALQRLLLDLLGAERAPLQRAAR